MKGPIRLAFYVFWVMVIVLLMSNLIYYSRSTVDELDHGFSEFSNNALSNASIYVMNDIKQHASKNDCWISLTDGVYNITSLVKSHTGGDVFSCGNDNTASFMGKHGAMFSIMDPYYIGKLVSSKGNNGGSNSSSEAPSNNSSSNENKNSTNGNNEGSNGNGVKTYTMSDIKQHASKNDCWVSLTDRVYDITSLVKSHTGGDVFSCGNDNTASFMGKHGLNLGIMDSYYIGKLASSSGNPQENNNGNNSSNENNNENQPGNNNGNNWDNNNSCSNGNNNNRGNNNGNNAGGSKTYTMSDIKQHASKNDCWVSLTDRVYDITSLVKSHTGGDVFSCGNDNTASFMGKHGLNLGIMDSYYIGKLVSSSGNPQENNNGDNSSGGSGKKGNSKNNSCNNTNNNGNGAKMYTMNDIRQHSSSTSCWISLTDGVYDITSLLKSHSGGNVFSCGKDNTALFMSKHKTKFSIMDPYYIGKLVSSTGSNNNSNGGNNCSNSGGNSGGGNSNGNGGSSNSKKECKKEAEINKKICKKEAELSKLKCEKNNGKGNEICKKEAEIEKQKCNNQYKMGKMECKDKNEYEDGHGHEEKRGHHDDEDGHGHEEKRGHHDDEDGHEDNDEEDEDDD